MSDGNGSAVVARASKKNRIAEILDDNGQKKEVIRVSKPNMKTIRLHLVGTAPYLQCRFPQKAINAIRAKHVAGDKGNKGKKKIHDARDFHADYLGSMHKISDTEYGIPAAAFRAASIRACKLVGLEMTMAKLTLFVVPDGYDVLDQTPLVKITVGKPQQHEMMGRNDNGSVDIRVRAIWPKWEADLTIRFDQDQFSTTDIVNLVARVGAQVGVGEGRPDSKNSAGMGMGLFDVVV